jgi:type IV pilus assembly protein PilF
MVISLVTTLFLSACAAPPSTTQDQLPPDALTNNPTAATYNTQLGVAYLQQGDVSRAKSKLLLAQQQNPASPEVWDALAYYYQSTGDNTQADKYYIKAISLAPKNGSTLNNYGAFLCQQRRYKESVSYFIKATQDSSYINTAQAFENAGLCAEEIPDKAAAETYFTRALANNPSLPTSTLELGEINFDKGNFDLANRYLQRYNYLAKPTAESLWLDIRLAQHAGNTQQVAASAQQLKDNFPLSDQYKQAKLSGLIT